MKETFYPTLEEALYLHDILIQRFGGKSGVLDCGLLESALARPRSGYYSSLSEQAAALMQSLAMNHPFVDGNKRVAFALTAVFLRINGLKLTVPAKDGVQFVEQTLIAEKASLAAITDWIEKHTR
ncbi:MAG: type II toxin-antitoxin system death-on-curing family toxin [Pseudomonadota bacterium]|jgi:death-on-curing protein